MRSSLLSAVRQITSSRQSPRMSAQRHGVAFVPLFDEQPGRGQQRRLGLRSPSPISMMVVRSSSSRSRSPSHQIAKLH